MAPLELVKLTSLMKLTSGKSDILIGLIDGPVDFNNPDLNNRNIREIPGSLSGTCTKSNSIACIHGTFVAGVLAAKRGSVAPAICPDCTLLIRPIFTDTTSKDRLPSSTPEELSHAVIDCIQSGVWVINLSAAIVQLSSKGERELREALDLAAKKGVIIVASSGNQGTVGSTIITRHAWVIPVIACNIYGIPMKLSNLGNSIGRNGLSAPGENITSLGSNVGNTFSGTSAAAPFITGTIALLWSKFPHLPASVIKQAVSIVNNRRSLTPPLIDAMKSLQYLNSKYKQKEVA